MLAVWFLYAIKPEIPEPNQLDGNTLVLLGSAFNRAASRAAEAIVTGLQRRDVSPSGSSIDTNSSSQSFGARSACSVPNEPFAALRMLCRAEYAASSACKRHRDAVKPC